MQNIPDIVETIFEAFDGPSVIAKETGFALQTVSDWRRNGNKDIPPWRRRDVLQAAQRIGVTLPADALAYLASDVRLPRTPSVAA
jgi:hypothetical protein